MASLVVLAAFAALALILAWAFGSFVLRWGGILFVIDGLGGLVVHHGAVTPWRMLEVMGGLAAWMVGHWLYAVKYQSWRSVLGRAPWRLPVLRWLTPIPSR